MARAPARAGILGNPTDGYGGCVINCTVPFHAEARFEPGPGFHAAFAGYAADLARPEAWRLQGDPLDLVRAVLDYLGPERVPRGRLEVQTAVPRQAGLAGSTALLAAILGALDFDAVAAAPQAATAERLRVVEARHLGVTCGFQDQYAAVFGGLNFMDFAGKAAQRLVPPDPPASVTPLPEPADAALPFVVAHTGMQRDSGAVHRPIRERWEAGEADVVDAYERIARLCRAGREAWGDWPAVGALMDENHALQRHLGGSSEANDALIAAAKRAGAWGAKLAGAGRGGTIIAAHPEPDRLAGALREAGATLAFHLRREPGLRLQRL